MGDIIAVSFAVKVREPARMSPRFLIWPKGRHSYEYENINFIGAANLKGKRRFGNLVICPSNYKTNTIRAVIFLLKNLFQKFQKSRRFHSFVFNISGMS